METTAAEWNLADRLLGQNKNVIAKNIGNAIKCFKTEFVCSVI